MTLRFGLLGTGYWAAQTQGAALAAHPEAELVAVWGRDPAKADDLAARLGARSCRELDGLLADVDAVAIAVPPDVQADLAVRAAAVGVHLLLDKPVAFGVTAADRVVAEVDRHQLASLVFFTSRYQPNITGFLRELAAAGPWDGARVTMFASIFQPGNPYGQSPWRRERGGLWDIGPHALAMILPVLGPVDRVTATEGPHATSHVTLAHRSGAVSTMALTLDAPAATTTTEFLFFGAPGRRPAPAGAGSAMDAFGVAISDLVRMVADGASTHPCDVRFGREVVAVLAAAQAASRQGCAVEP